MTKETLIIIDSTVEIFSRWLEKHTSFVWWEKFPTETGHLSLHPATIVWRPHVGLGPLTMAMGAVREVEKSTRDEGAIYPAGTGISFELMPLAAERLEITAKCHNDVYEAYFDALLREIRRRWPPEEPRRNGVERDNAQIPEGSSPPGIKGKPGRRRVEEANPEEFLYRIAKAQEAEEWREQDPTMTWKEIAKEIGWTHGHTENGLGILRTSRRRLQDLKIKDPNGWLPKVQEYRRESGPTKTMKT